MADEISTNYLTSKTVYACRFQLDGNVFLTDGSSDEVWGAGGNDADDYDITLTETNVGNSQHYVGSFDASSNIVAGVYPVAIYEEAGVNPADGDTAIAQGMMYWDGVTEIDPFSLDNKVNIIDDNIRLILEKEQSVLNVYDER